MSEAINFHSLILVSPEILNKSTQNIYYFIRRKQMVNSSDIKRKTNYGDRTIRSAIRRLIDLRLIRRIPNLQDMRSCYYQATPN